MRCSSSSRPSRDDTPAHQASIRADENGASSVLSVLDGSFDPGTATYENRARLFYLRLLDSTRVAIEVGRERMGTDKRPGTIDLTHAGRQIGFRVRDGAGRGVASINVELTDDPAAYRPANRQGRRDRRDPACRASSRDRIRLPQRGAHRHGADCELGVANRPPTSTPAGHPEHGRLRPELGGRRDHDQLGIPAEGPRLPCPMSVEWSPVCRRPRRLEISKCGPSLTRHAFNRSRAGCTCGSVVV